MKITLPRQDAPRRIVERNTQKGNDDYEKMTAILLILAMALLPSCRESGIAGTTVPPDTTVPETTAPPQTQLPETNPPETNPPETTAPQETLPPAEMLTSIPWEVPEPVTLTYEAYFSEIHLYGYPLGGSNMVDTNGNWGGLGDNFHSVYLRKDGTLIVYHDDTPLRVGTQTYENVYVAAADERWIYMIEDGRELFRIDYFGENRQTLFVDETGKMHVDSTSELGHISLAENCVLFFAAGAGDGYGIYRLYLPDMTLDLMATSEAMITLLRPYSNHEITWLQDNPAFDTLYEQLMNDPNSEYSKMEYGADVAVACGEGVPMEYDYYYNSCTKEKYRIPFYGDTQHPERYHGYVWWDSHPQLEEVN